MPQISPMSWVLVPFLFFAFFFVFLFSFWWCLKGFFDFKNLSVNDGKLLSSCVWKW